MPLIFDKKSKKLPPFDGKKAEKERKFRKLDKMSADALRVECLNMRDEIMCLEEELYYAKAKISAYGDLAAMFQNEVLAIIAALRLACPDLYVGTR